MTSSPAPTTPYYPESAMAVFAHPDDIEFGCAGTLALWAKHGARIALVLLTSGDVGIARSDLSRTQAAAIREAEASAAAKIIGAQEILFMREPDGMLEATMSLRKRLVREIRRFRPEVLIAGDPQQLWSGDNYINHPDHRAAGWVAIDAVFPAAGQPHIFEDLSLEGLKAHKVRKVYILNWTETGTSVEITETIEVKVAALKEHKSQMGDWDVEKNLKEWAGEIGKKFNVPYAESFRVVTLESDENWEKYRGHNDGR